MAEYVPSTDFLLNDLIIYKFLIHYKNKLLDIKLIIGIN